MRGSPLIRSLLLVLALGLAAVGIRTLAQPARQLPAPPPESSVVDHEPHLNTPFFLTLSAPAQEVVIESGGETLSLKPEDLNLTGSIPLAPGHPTIFITVRWKDQAELPRFAKLTLEPPGLPTLRRTFDAIGEISDVWEPHLH